MSRTVYECLRSNECMNEAIVDIRAIVVSKKLTIAEAVVVLDIIKTAWINQLIETDAVICNHSVCMHIE